LETYGVKVPVVTTENYILYLERTPWQDLFIHCDFTGKWNKENKKKFLEDLEKLCNSIDEPIYAMPFIYDKRMQSFLKICNFIKLADVLCGDGVTRAVHIWRK
jgi:hypothetical protein